MAAHGAQMRAQRFDRALHRFVAERTAFAQTLADARADRAREIDVRNVGRDVGEHDARRVRADREDGIVLAHRAGSRLRRIARLGLNSAARCFLRRKCRSCAGTPSSSFSQLVRAFEKLRDLIVEFGLVDLRCDRHHRATAARDAARTLGTRRCDIRVIVSARCASTSPAGALASSPFSRRTVAPNAFTLMTNPKTRSITEPAMTTGRGAGSRKRSLRSGRPDASDRESRASPPSGFSRRRSWRSCHARRVCSAVMSVWVALSALASATF